MRFNSILRALIRAPPLRLNPAPLAQLSLAPLSLASFLVQIRPFKVHPRQDGEPLAWFHLLLLRGVETLHVLQIQSLVEQLLLGAQDLLERSERRALVERAV